MPTADPIIPDPPPDDPPKPRFAGASGEAGGRDIIAIVMTKCSVCRTVAVEMIAETARREQAGATALAAAAPSPGHMRRAEGRADVVGIAQATLTGPAMMKVCKDAVRNGFKPGFSVVLTGAALAHWGNVANGLPLKVRMAVEIIRKSFPAPAGVPPETKTKVLHDVVAAGWQEEVKRLRISDPGTPGRDTITRARLALEQAR
jgi:hypothetical protein